MHFNNITLNSKDLMKVFLWANTIESGKLVDTVGKLAVEGLHDQITILLKLMKPKHRDYILKQWQGDESFWSHAFRDFEQALGQDEESDASVLLSDASEPWKCFVCGVELENISGATFRLKQCGACVSHDSCWEEVRRKVLRDKKQKQKLNPMYPYIGPCHCAHIGSGPEEDWEDILSPRQDGKRPFVDLFENAIAAMKSRRKLKAVGPAEKRRRVDDAGDVEEEETTYDVEETGQKRKVDNADTGIEPASKRGKMNHDNAGDVEEEETTYNVEETGQKRKVDNAETGIEPASKRGKMNHDNAGDESEQDTEGGVTDEDAEEKITGHNAIGAGEKRKADPADRGAEIAAKKSKTTHDTAGVVGEKRKIDPSAVSEDEETQPFKKHRSDGESSPLYPANEV